GIDAAAAERECDPSALGYREVGAFADHLCPDFIAVDTESIVGPVAGFSVSFGRGLDIGADAAEPQQIDASGQELAGQFGGSEMVRLDIEGAPHLGADGD